MKTTEGSHDGRVCYFPVTVTTGLTSSGRHGDLFHRLHHAASECRLVTFKTIRQNIRVSFLELNSVDRQKRLSEEETVKT